MSIKVMSLVWEHADVSGSELLILMALADYGNDEGGQIYPSMAKLAEKARISAAQARRTVHKLIEAGYVILVEPGGWRHGRNWANQYGLNLKRLGGTGKMQAPSMDASTVLSQMQGGGTGMDASTVLAPVQEYPSLEPSLTTNSDTDVSEQPHAKPPKRKRSKKNPDEPKPPKPSEHPLNQAYHTLHDRYPSTAQMKIIIAKNPPLDDWIRAMNAWAEWGYSLTNIGGMLEWALDPAKIRVHKPAQNNVQSAFGLQRNGTHNATTQQASTTPDEEQPAYDSEFGRAIRDSNRRMAEEYAAKQAARRGVSLPHL